MLFSIILIQLIQLTHFDVEDINDLRQSLRTLFYISPGRQKLSGIYYFSEITSRSDFKFWVYNMTSNIYESSDPRITPNNFFAQKCSFLGPPVLLKFETKSGKGGNPLFYYSNYNEKTKRTKDLYDPDDGDLFEWGKFQTKEELGLIYNLQGYLSDYDEGGYPLEFGLEDEKLEKIQKKLKKLDKFLSTSTLAANFILSGYILDIDYFFSLNLAIEKTPSGGFQPIKKSIEVFRPGLNWNYLFMTVGDVVVYTLTLFLIAIYCRTLYEKLLRGKMLKFMRKINFILLFSYAMCESAYIYFNSKAMIKDDGIAMVNRRRFLDIRPISWRFKATMRLKGFSTGIALMLMIAILNYKITKKFSIRILNVVIQKNLLYVLMILPVFLGLSVLGETLLGQYSEDFTSFSTAFIGVLLFSAGRVSKVF